MSAGTGSPSADRESPVSRSPWECHICGWTNLAHVEVCDGCDAASSPAKREELLRFEIGFETATRASVAIAYAACLSDEQADWRSINQAIIDRWSPSGLDYIKRQAWKRRHG